MGLLLGCKNTVIPTDIYGIREEAFAGCTGLTSITIPDNIDYILHDAFYGCSNLASVEFPSGLARIGERAFKNCTSLDSIALPDSLNLIENEAFSGCTNLTRVVSKTPEPLDIDENTFTNRANAILYVPDFSVEDYNNAQYWKEFNQIIGFKTGDDEREDIITFADPIVKDICVTYWDTDKDGELSMEEAAKVTNLQEMFFFNEDITSFDELQYFTGLTYLGGDDDAEDFNNSFEQCTNLTSITLPNSLKSLKLRAFSGCSSLTDIHIPGSVESIGSAVFATCESLKCITVSEENTCYDSRDNCNAIIETSSNTLVAGCMNTAIPNSVTAIGESAFLGYSMTQVTIPCCVTSIGDWAFGDCTSLTRVEIPNSVTTIGEGAFSGCDNLTKVVVGIPTPLDISQNTFSNYEATLYVPKGCKEDYQQTDIWMNFIRIQEFVSDAYDDTDLIVFADPKVKEICLEWWDFNDDGELSMTEAAMVVDLEEAFTDSDITSFDELYYFSGLDVIGERAFDGCQQLKYVVIPNSVTEIQSSAFNGCESLTSINIPAHVAELGYGVFGSCNQLESITVAEGNASFFSPGNSNAVIERSSGKLLAGCKNTIVPDFVTAIGVKAFYGCADLTQLELPATLTGIESQAFAYSGLTSLVVPNTVSQIEAEAFIGCTNLVSINIPDALRTISLSTFEDCKSLTGIEIPSSVTTIESGAFEDCTSLTSIEIPHSVTSIGNYVFYGCSNLASVAVDIPVPLAIEDHTFSNYDATLYVPKSCVEAYQTADHWKNFKMIEKLSIPVQYALLSTNKKSLTFYYDTDDDEREGTIFYVGYSDVPAWLGQCGRVARVTFDPSFDSVHPTSLRQWFGGMTLLTAIEGMEHLNTSEATTMAALFKDCSNLRKVDLSHVDISKATDLSEMFSGCSSIATLDLSSFAPTDDAATSEMFLDCHALKTLKLPKAMAAIADDACQGVGTNSAPCLLFVPTDFAFSEEPVGTFIWKSGYFRVADEPVVYARDTDFASGEVKNIAICLKNGSEKYNAYEFDLTLPEGFSFMTKDNGSVAYTLGNRYPGDVSVSTSLLDGSTCRVTAYMDPAEYMTGTNGMFISLSVKAASDLPLGAWEAKLSNIFVGMPNNVSVRCSDSTFQLVINSEESFLLGDVNHDGTINMMDVIAVINYILNRPTVFFAEEADVNADGWISMSDVTGIINIILHKVPNMAPANARYATLDHIYMEKSADGYDLCLDNLDDYTACELTLALPEGCSLRHASMSDQRSDRHHVLIARLADGRWRVAVYSDGNDMLRDGEPAMVHLAVDGGAGDDVSITDILFVDSQDAGVVFPDVTGTTGIARTDSDTDDTPVYNLQGIRVQKTTRGVQVSNRRKTVVR